MNSLKRFAKPLAWLSALLVAAVVAGCGGGGDQGRDPILGLPSADLVSVVVTPGTASIAGGARQQFLATATYSDGAARDVTALSAWTSGTPAVASVGAATGLASGLAVGSTAVAAAFNGKSGSATLTVTGATLVSIAITPAVMTIPTGGQQQFIATGTFTDGSASNITAITTFSSATAAVATSTAGGLARGVAAGTSVISGSSGGKVGTALLTVNAATLVSIAVTPATPALAIGAPQQFAATGTFSDGSASNLSAIATFTSSVPAIATSTVGGLVTGVAAGASVITATSGNVAGSTGLTVLPAALVSIAVTPALSTIQVGGSAQLAVTATYANGTTGNVSASAVYVSATPGAASVNPATGLATGVAAGSTIITASFGGKTATATVTVNAATLVSIAVTPVNASILVGGVQAFTATGTYSDNHTANISANVAWTSDSLPTATVLAGGSASGLAVGSARITATLGTLSASGLLTVTAPVVIVPVTVNLGAASNFAVLAGTSITNNSGGTTLVTGDVGAPSQTTDPVQAAGFANYKSGANLTNALDALQVAITDARGRTCDVNSASGIDLGGLTLGPGVYCYAGAISLTGTFTMNGPGVYIFRTASTINTTANSIVALSAGASADSAFWVPTGPTTLGANSVFKGTIMGQSAAITLGDNTTLQNGRVLSAAAVTLRNNQISR
jgi:hypothetical protein